MARYLLLALNGPTKGDGDEKTYNDWYNEVHIPDLKGVPGVKSARRYKVVQGNLKGMENYPYLAAYEIETDDLAAVFKYMEHDIRPFTPAFDRTTSGNLVAVQIGED